MQFSIQCYNLVNLYWLLLPAHVPPDNILRFMLLNYAGHLERQVAGEDGQRLRSSLEVGGTL